MTEINQRVNSFRKIVTPLHQNLLKRAFNNRDRVMFCFRKMNFLVYVVHNMLRIF